MPAKNLEVRDLSFLRQIFAKIQCYQKKSNTLSDNQKKIQSLCTWRVNTLNHLLTWIRSTKCDILLQRKKNWRKIKKKWKFLVIYPQFSLHLCFQLPLFFLLRNKNTEEEGQKPALNQLLRGRSQAAEQLGWSWVSIPTDWASKILLFPLKIIQALAVLWFSSAQHRQQIQSHSSSL